MALRSYDLPSNYHIEDPLNKLVYQITSVIKNTRDFNSAINLILQNNLKLEDVVSRTARLTLEDVVKLADLLISKK
ncbi:hypothetical protein CRV08_02915 [Halarcobacter ebronensis]|uniref:Uncharacterized protein n=1 Tax=Halarcobacter ebronensis TaxID=1462615 RepID=A0A4Q0YKQ9_9BACT|nr:hypothetical protein [Halarcobacter ebronensis]RXJ69671.1 hypothetical protein CRV08_02915 [Halarcobacter ebronensis]